MLGLGAEDVLLSCLRREHLKFYLSQHFLPLKKFDDVLVVGVTDRFKSHEFVYQIYRGKIKFVPITEKRFIKILQLKFSSYFLNSSVLKLHLSKPLYSSKKLAFSRTFILILLLGFFLFLGFAHEKKIYFFIRLSNLILILNILFKFVMLKGQPRQTVDSNIECELPKYSILLPLFKETESTLEGLINSIKHLNYPQELLDVKLIVEQFDKKTIQAVKKLSLPKYFQIICIKSGQPNTKPKACNYALNFVTGKYVVVYDAEDRPEPDQLIKAVREFSVSDKKTICLQARIGFYNRRSSFLAAQMSIEYKIWFERFLKFLEGKNSAIPLGGSSNHFKVKELVRLKGWDPYNVTEDADLGIRIHKYRFKTKMLDSITMEEGPVSVWSWLKQRSRWIKGHITTYCVHLRSAKAFIAKDHPLSIIYFHLFLLMPTLSFFYPFLYVIALYVSNVKIKECLFSSVMSLVLWIIFCWYSSFINSKLFSFKKRVFLVIFSPFYYILHSFSSVLAIAEFIFCPSYWRKTSHFFRERIVSSKKQRILKRIYALLFN